MMDDVKVAKSGVKKVDLMVAWKAESMVDS